MSGLATRSSAPSSRIRATTRARSTTARTRVNGPYTTFLGLQEFGGSDYSLRYSGIFGSSWVVAAQGALHQEQNSVDPALPGGDEIQYIDTVNANLESGGFGLIQDKTFKRYLARRSLTKYLGNNEIKGGIESWRTRPRSSSGCPAASRSRSTTTRAAPGLLPLLLDDSDREPAGQRADVAADGHAGPQDVFVLPPGHRDAAAQPDGQRRTAL